MIPKLIRNYNAAAAIAANRIVAPGANDLAVVPAAAVADAMIGVSSNIDVANGEPCDVILAGIANVRLGGTVARGGFVTAGAAGVGVAAAPAADANARVVGVALASGVTGDIIPVLVVPAMIQGTT